MPRLWDLSQQKVALDFEIFKTIAPSIGIGVVCAALVVFWRRK